MNKKLFTGIALVGVIMVIKDSTAAHGGRGHGGGGGSRGGGMGGGHGMSTSAGVVTHSAGMGGRGGFASRGGRGDMGMARSASAAGLKMVGSRGVSSQGLGRRAAQEGSHINVYGGSVGTGAITTKRTRDFVRAPRHGRGDVVARAGAQRVGGAGVARGARVAGARIGDVRYGFGGRTWSRNWRRYGGYWGRDWRGFGQSGRWYPWFFTSFNDWYVDPCWSYSSFGGRRFRYYCYYDAYPWLVDLIVAGKIADARRRIEEERLAIEEIRDEQERRARMRELEYLEGGLERGGYEE